MTSTTSTTSRRPAQPARVRAALAAQPAREPGGPAAGPGGPRLLEDKLRVARPSLPLLPRRRLTELIERASAHRVTLVSGPAGAGKTVACSAWAAGRAGHGQVAWLTLDRQDAEPARFWAYVRAALAQAGPVAAEAAGSLADVSAGDAPMALAAAAQLLGEPVALVLDDVQELSGGPAVASLDELIRHAPPALRLILSGRCQPGLQLARLRVSGDLAEVDARDLACTAEELDAYLAMLGLAAGTAERDRLLARTEGWMAGLRLAVLRTGRTDPGGPTPPDPPGGAGPGGPTLPGSAGSAGPGGPTPPDPPGSSPLGPALPAVAAGIADIAGDEQAVTDYLADEVLGRLGEQTRLFLLRTSVAGECVRGDLADAVTGEPGGARTLDLLSRENSFVDSCDSDGGCYRYHPLLRDVLRAELRRRLPQEIPVLLRRAARWYCEHGAVLDALRCAAEAGDWDYGAYVLADAGPAALTGPGAAGLEAVLGLFPAQARADDAAVAAACAAARLWRGDPQGAAAHLDAAQHALDRLPDQLRPAVEPGLAAMRILHAASQAAADPGLLARGAALAGKAGASAGTPAEHRAVGLLWYALGCARLGRFEARQAALALAQAGRQLGAGGPAGLRARAAAWRSLALAWHGELAEAEQAAADAVAAAAARPGPAGQPGTGCWPALLGRAAVCLARDELDASRDLLDEADRAAAGHLPGEPRPAVLTALARARALAADGDTAAARSLMIRLREREGGTGPALHHAMTVLDGEIALRAGDCERARMVLAPDGAGEPHERADSRLACGRLLLAEGSFAEALDTVRPLLAAGPVVSSPVVSSPVVSGTDGPDLPVKIGALLVAAVAQRRLGQAGPAGEHLEQALALAEPDAVTRPFLDVGQAARSAITVLIPPDSPGAGFAARIQDRFASQLPRAAQAPRQPEAALTDSELAVLRFLPSHMTNQEIAEALFLSINTVKTHLRSAYRKLGVSSRRQAIGRGRRLDLL
jgi:LuxR family transcriptional regulator, maltose regulon positive regulatory protein